MLSDSSGLKPANLDKFFGCRAEDRGATLHSRNGSQRDARSRQVGAKSIAGSHRHAASHDKFRSAVEPSHVDSSAMELRFTDRWRGLAETSE